jgi:hypothetical protein
MLTRTNKIDDDIAQLEPAPVVSVMEESATGFCLDCPLPRLKIKQEQLLCCFGLLLENRCVEY